MQERFLHNASYELARRTHCGKAPEPIYEKLVIFNYYFNVTRHFTSKIVFELFQRFWLF